MSENPLTALYADIAQLSEADKLAAAARMFAGGGDPCRLCGRIFELASRRCRISLFATVRSALSEQSVQQRVYQSLGNRADGELISDDAF